MTFTTSIAQKGVRIAYIDFNEIIEKISDYRQAIQSLESKAQNWNKEIEIKKMKLKSMEDQLNSEKFLLTNELVKDREDELTIYRDEIFSLQNANF